jgi:hypothetical protein
VKHKWSRIPGVRPSQVENWICLQCGMVKRRVGARRYLFAPRVGDGVIAGSPPAPCPGDND